MSALLLASIERLILLHGRGEEKRREEDEDKDPKSKLREPRREGSSSG